MPLTTPLTQKAMGKVRTAMSSMDYCQDQEILTIMMVMVRLMIVMMRMMIRMMMWMMMMMMMMMLLL